jgi:TPR repeat protein
MLAPASAGKCALASRIRGSGLGEPHKVSARLIRRKRELARELSKVDRPAATKWFELAIGQGSVVAMHNYAVLLRSTEPDRSMALFQLAAEAGYAPSAAALASRCER